MKKSIVIAVFLAVTGFAFAQSAQYTAAMTKNIAALDAAESTEDLQKVANAFARIAANESSEWLPAYYQAYSHIILAIANMQADDMATCQSHLDQAQKILDGAMKIAPKESELHVLQGYVFQGRIWEDAMNKGPEFTPKVMQSLQTAMALNEENPRAYHLMGQQLYHTPEFFGGGAKAALPMLEKAAARFASYEAPSDLHPTWGEPTNTALMENAQKQLAKK